MYAKPRVPKRLLWRTTKRNVKFSMYHQYLFIYLNKQKTRLSTLAYSKYEFSNVASNAMYDQIYAAYVLYFYLYIFIIFLYSEISLRPCTVRSDICGLCFKYIFIYFYNFLYSEISLRPCTVRSDICGLCFIYLFIYFYNFFIFGNFIKAMYSAIRYMRLMFYIFICIFL